MCPPGCLHSMCEQATRRGLLKTGFSLGIGALAAASTLGAATRPAFAAAPVPAPGPVTINKMVDLSHTLYDEFPTYGGDKWFAMENVVNYKKDKINLNRWIVMEHVGTHMDAPIHFSADGKTADLLPLTDLLVPVAVIDISARAASNPDATVTPDDIKAWEAKNGPLPEGCCVVMNSGWHKLVGDSLKFRGKDDKGLFHTPGFHVETAKMLISERSVKGIGVDTMSIDTGYSTNPPEATFPVHYTWLPTGRWGVECLANLDNFPEKGGYMLLGIPKVKGATGGPTRVIGIL